MNFNFKLSKWSLSLLFLYIQYIKMCCVPIWMPTVWIQGNILRYHPYQPASCLPHNHLMLSSLMLTWSLEALLSPGFHYIYRINLPCSLERFSFITCSLPTGVPHGSVFGPALLHGLDDQIIWLLLPLLFLWLTEDIRRNFKMATNTLVNILMFVVSNSHQLGNR